jgi:CheY-like chemotaxis protein
VISGKIRLKLVTIDVHSLVGNAVESFAPVAKSRGLDLARSLDADVGEIRADAARLEQVVGNLLSNAVKFTPAGGSIRVSAARSGTSVEIRVTDSGAGIAPEFIPFVFDRFRQADTTTTRAHGGLGLGLAMARHLVELHGGNIRAESAGENKGSSFTVVLPAVGVVPLAAGAVLDGAPARDVPLVGLQILIVDDSPDALQLLDALLSGAGARVDTAASVDAAERRLMEMRPDLLIADIAMPRIDGCALMHGIRARERQTGEPRLFAIALSACARDEDRRRSLGAGFDLHLTKPIEPAAILEVLRGVAARGVAKSGSGGLVT